MYKSFKIKNFRGFKESTIDGMTKINLITGLNNVGKTAMLDAFFLHSGSNNPSSVLIIDAFRGLENRKVEYGGNWFESPWKYIFKDFDTTQLIELEGIYDDAEKRVLDLRVVVDSNELTEIYRRFLHTSIDKLDSENIGLSTDAHVLEFLTVNGKNPFIYYLMQDRSGSRSFPIPPGNPYPVIYVHSKSRFTDQDAERFGKLQANKKENLIFKALRSIEPRLKSLSLVLENNMHLLEGDIGGPKLVPLQLMGEGMNRLTSLVLAIAEVENGVALIDEIENGFHYTVYPKVWQVIKEASALFKTQIIATTHSFECISAASAVFRKSELDQFSLHRLERSGEITRTVDFDQKSISSSVESSYEVR